MISLCFFFFFQAEDGIRDLTVTGVQTCALPISCGGCPYCGDCAADCVSAAGSLRQADRALDRIDGRQQQVQELLQLCGRRVGDVEDVLVLHGEILQQEERPWVLQVDPVNDGYRGLRHGGRRLARGGRIGRLETEDEDTCSVGSRVEETA